MSKRRKNSFFWLKISALLLLIISILGLLGAFGLSIGKHFDAFFTLTMGGLAWAGPFLCFIIGVILWIYASTITTESSISSERSPKDDSKIPNTQKRQERRSKEKSQDPNVFPLPAGKIVSLKGFDQYFNSPELVEMKDKDAQMSEEMQEIGRDFPSYFGTGESGFPTKRRNMTVLKGLNDYFTEVDQEVRLEVSSSDHKYFEPAKLSKILTEKPASYSTVFKSKIEQEEYLSQFKEDENPLNEKLDFVENRSEDIRISSEAGGVVETSQAIDIPIPKNETVLETTTDSDSDSERPETGYGELTEQTVKGVAWNTSALTEAVLETACTVESVPMSDLAVAPVAEEPALTFEFEEQVEQIAQVEQVLDHKAEVVKHWEFPNFNLLEPLQHRTIIQDTETSRQLEKVLLDFGVKAKLIRVTRGPVITRYELAPAPGVKISKIVNLSDDIALALAARDVRIEAPIPGKAAIGIEVPNKQALSVPFREVLETASFGQYSSKLKVALGKDIADQPIIADLIKMPHLLVAGATGSGKSVCITTIINSLLFNATPDEVKLLLVDPKMVELSQYNGIPHLLAPVVIDPKKAASALKWIVKEMENRYELFAASGVRDIERYNRLKAAETSRNTPALPFVVVIIDELADLMMVAAGEVEEAICRLAQMARAAGIHLVIATQRPSVDVITGVIKANIPSRISFAVSSQIDSRTILDATGAEKLLGRGDMLYSPLGVNKALRVQGCLVTDEEVQRVIMHWKEMGKPEYLDPERLFAETTVKSEEGNGPDDALFLDAGHLFIRTGMASVSFLQRRLKLGYTRAARLMDMLEEQGVVGAYEGSKPRQVLLTLEEFDERFG
ncbi:DNA translocase FtsK [Desulfosporosinus shakirovi]|uniref:DNA translocase FtsK n=1 Tax=Desulfosporosinus shakirovi TaxID=2885154 RepID=UPI001E5E2AC0|nr:DNA translocase FtsK [Desulfosporosinus sp. SRJS8]MCB8816549.1 DNA translocase FtsK [Desulfosporosinus sp. SRJS8]